jgi:hypothetical protein
VADGRGDFADAALFVAVGTHRLTGELLADVAAPGSTEAAGWLGDLRLVDALLGQLRCGKPEDRLAAASALEMLTGAGLFEPSATTASRNDEPPPFPNAPGDAPIGDLESPLVDPDTWAAWWKQHGSRANPAKRYRFGRLWTSRSNLSMLRHPASKPRDRFWARLELVARIGEPFPLDLRAFVAPQEAAIDAWAETVARRLDGVSPGTWPSAPGTS